MELNKRTFETVKGLLNIPTNYVGYSGADKDGVFFEVGYKDERNNLISGVSLKVSESFKILKVERIYISWGRYCRNWPVKKELLPIHPAGQTISLYKRTA